MRFAFQILIGLLPFWEQLRQRRVMQAIMRGLNAAVVGVLAAALYTPLWTSAVHHYADYVLVIAGFVLLTVAKLPSWLVVAGSAVTGIIMTVSHI